jgi:hypothetical protein
MSYTGRISANYPYDAVQVSSGASPVNMFTPSNSSNVQNGVEQGPRSITVVSGTNYNFSTADATALFPTSGVYSLRLDSAGTADLSSVGRVTKNSDGSNSFSGFQATTSLSGAAFAQYAQMLCAGGPPSTTITLQQNTGSNVVYSAYSTKLSN